MARVLQLTAHQPDFQTLRTVDALMRGLADDVAMTRDTIGRGGTYRNEAFAAMKLWRMEPEFLVHAWGLPALRVARVSSRRIIFSPTEPPSKRTLSILKRAMKQGSIELAAPSENWMQAATRFGLDAARCHLVRPAIALDRPAADRAAIRQRLGFADDQFVMLAVGESTRAAAHIHALWTASILHVLDNRYRLLLWGHGSDVTACQRLGAKLRQPNLLTVATERLGKLVEFEDLLAAADVALYTTKQAGSELPLAECMRAGIPVLAMPDAAAFLRDEHTCLSIPKRSARMLAQRVLELRENPTLRERLVQNGRAIAGELFSLPAMLAGFKKICAAIE